MLWRDVKIGDFVYLYKNEMAPADMVLLDTNEIRDKSSIVYVDTELIDG